MNKIIRSLSKKAIALICVGIVLNIMGCGIVTRYSVPLFLDNIGTFLVSVLLGPLPGAFTGAAYNIIMGFFNRYDALYAIVSICGAFVVGRLLCDKERVDSFRIVATSVLAGIVTVAASTPLNMVLQSGFTGNEWGDAFVEMLSESINIKLFCCIMGELIVNIPDKILTLLLVMAALALFRKANFLFKEEIDNDHNKADAKKLLSVVLLVCIIPLGLTDIVSADEDTDATVEKSVDFGADYAYTNYGTSDGLSSAEINAIAQTNDGYIWAGAYSGLYLYDGTTFEKVNLDSRITNVIDLFTDSNGRLWIATNDCGAACYDPYIEEIKFFSTKEGLCSNSVRSICEDEDGNIYLATSSYLCKMTLKEADMVSDRSKALKLSTIMIYDQYSSINYVGSLSSIGNGRICGVTGEGSLFMLMGDKLKFSKVCEDEGVSYTSLAFNDKSSVLVGTTGGYVQEVMISSLGFTVNNTYNLKGLEAVDEVLYSNSFAGYFFACENGFGYISEGGEVQNITTDDFSVAISDVIIDKQSDIWFASSKQGILKLSKNPFTDLFEEDQIKRSAVNAVLYNDGALYVATDEGVVKIGKDKGGIEQNVLDEFDGIRVRHIMRDSKGDFWLSTYEEDGLVKISKKGDIKTFTESNSDIVGDRFRFAIELNDGRILSASSSGLNFIENDKVQLTIAEENMSVPKALSAVQDEDGTIWVSTDGGGIYTIKDDVVTEHFGAESGLESQVVMKIVPCQGGRIYVASNGLYYHEDNKDIRKLENFPYTNNYDVYIREDGTTFVTSSAGIFVTSLENLLADKNEYNCALLGANRGLRTTLTANAWDTVNEDVMYLCCTDGVRSFNLITYEEFDLHYQIVLREVEKEGLYISPVNGVYNIPAGSGQITVTPALLNYTISDPLLSIQLEGSDKEPIYIRQSELATIYYPELSFGDYQLVIKVLNDSGTDVIKETSFLFRKEAKLYERIYYKIYLIASFSFMLIFVVWLIAKMGNMALINKQYNQIRMAKEEAENANSAKTRFVAQISHEIRTPINVVLGMDEMILRRNKDPEIKGYAADIYNAGNTLLALVNDILDSARIESGKMEINPIEYELANLIYDVVNTTKIRARHKDIKIITDISPALCKRLCGDDIRIKQIITNLLTNAVKYTLQGTVWLRMDGQIIEDNLKMHIEVEDTGIGIKEEDIPKLFGEYERIQEGANRGIEGTGLGMNITNKLLKLMDSKLEVKSIYGQGSKFSFELVQKIVDYTPMGDYEEAAKAQALDVDEALAFIAPDARILVVDDNAMNRKVFKSLLTPTKIQIFDAASGNEAINKASRCLYDIVFMDHLMPNMDGVETLNKIRQIEGYKNIPVIALTANRGAQCEEEYLSYGFDGYLTKPISVMQLEEIIKNKLPTDLIEPIINEELNDQIQNIQSNQRPDDLPQVNGLDWDYAWIHIPDIEILRVALSTFYDNISLQASKLDDCYMQLVPKVGNKSKVSLSKESDEYDDPLKAYSIQAHSMKSSAAAVGLIELSAVARILEFASKDGNLKVIHALHKPFIEEWNSYREQLNGIFGLGASED